mmetsp:Transcript_163137/g.523134  ORF Transcript_163137/g.523134 Transcript_163137/m.523134 type:complete len:204 (+) Transcript_163137:683-1294(+)
MTMKCRDQERGLAFSITGVDLRTEFTENFYHFHMPTPSSQDHGSLAPLVHGLHLRIQVAQISRQCYSPLHRCEMQRRRSIQRVGKVFFFSGIEVCPESPQQSFVCGTKKSEGRLIVTVVAVANLALEVHAQRERRRSKSLNVKVHICAFYYHRLTDLLTQARHSRNEQVLGHLAKCRKQESPQQSDSRCECLGSGFYLMSRSK